MRYRTLAVLFTTTAVAVAGNVLMVQPAMAADAVALVYDTQATADAVVGPFVPGVPDTGAIATTQYLNPANPDGGGSAYSQRYCGKYQWNDGTEAGNHSKPQQPCLGGDGRDYLVGTGTRDNGTASAEGGYMDILHGYGGDDFLSGGESYDTLWGDAGNDILDGGIGNDYLTGGSGQDDMSGGQGADSFYAADGERDVIHCADSASDADGDNRLGDYDYVQYDAGLDVLDASCDNATKDPQ
jgi:Ca2+-binding RTX toxin-like protein